MTDTDEVFEKQLILCHYQKKEHSSKYDNREEVNVRGNGEENDERYSTLDKGTPKWIYCSSSSSVTSTTSTTMTSTTTDHSTATGSISNDAIITATTPLASNKNSIETENHYSSAKQRYYSHSLLTVHNMNAVLLHRKRQRDRKQRGSIKVKLTPPTLFNKEQSNDSRYQQKEQDELHHLKDLFQNVWVYPLSTSTTTNRSF